MSAQGAWNNGVWIRDYINGLRTLCAANERRRVRPGTEVMAGTSSDL